MDASYILKSTNIFDGIASEPVAGGLVVTGNRIVGIVPFDELDHFAGPATEVIECDDKLITPGFIDSHTHMGQALDFLDETYCIDLGSARSFDEVISMMRGFADRNPDNSVVYAVGFNRFNLDPVVIPTVQLLDEAFPDRPVLIQTWEVHTYYANSLAIRMAGITKDTPDPNDGIGKDGNGELTGAFNDTVAFAFQKIVQRPAEQRKGALKRFMDALNSEGITCVADMYPCGTERPYPLFKMMEDQLTVRISFYPELMSFTPGDIEDYKTNYNGPMLQFGGLKNLLDGVISVHTAWMSEPYHDDPTTRGHPAIPAEDVRAKILEAMSMGINVRIHAIGDAAVHYVLDVFEEARARYGRLPRRNVMEHLEYVRDEDIPRFAELDVIPAMQGRHITFYVDDGEAIMGSDRIKLAFRWRDILDTGAIIATGSDYPVVSFNPGRCVYAAVTRQHEDGHPKGGWLPEQRVSLADVLRAYTYGSACAINREDELGMLAPGMLADVTVWNCDLFSVPEEEYLNMHPAITMVDGRVVYEG